MQSIYDEMSDLFMICSNPVVQDECYLTPSMITDLKEVFMLFDKDEDGVLIFPEIETVMKLLGLRPTGWILVFSQVLSQDYLRNYLINKLDLKLGFLNKKNAY